MRREVRDGEEGGWGGKEDRIWIHSTTNQTLLIPKAPCHVTWQATPMSHDRLHPCHMTSHAHVTWQSTWSLHLLKLVAFIKDARRFRLHLSPGHTHSIDADKTTHIGRGFGKLAVLNGQSQWAYLLDTSSGSLVISTYAPPQDVEPWLGRGLGHEHSNKAINAKGLLTPKDIDNKGLWKPLFRGQQLQNKDHFVWQEHGSSQQHINCSAFVLVKFVEIFTESVFLQHGNTHYPIYGSARKRVLTPLPSHRTPHHHIAHLIIT